MKKKITKRYSNGEVTVVWQPHLCIHSENCFHNLGSVFNPNVRPWVNMDGADSKEIMQAVDKCPSGALSYQRETSDSEKSEAASPMMEVSVLENGPYLLKGNFLLTGSDGKTVQQEKVSLCRCGGSKNKPFCDGTHKEIGFNG